MFKNYLASQFSKPHGIGGLFMSHIFAKDNQKQNDWVISLLNIQPDDKILEIGYGNGKSIFKLAQKYNAFISGIDSSKIMFKKASQLNKEKIKTGNVEIKLGEVPPLPYNDETFNKIFAVYVLYFWDKPLDVLKEIYRILKKGGAVALYLSTKETLKNISYTQTKIFHSYTAKELTKLYQDAGFEKIRMEYFNNNEGICAIGQK